MRASTIPASLNASRAMFLYRYRDEVLPQLGFGTATCIKLATAAQYEVTRYAPYPAGWDWVRGHESMVSLCR